MAENVEVGSGSPQRVALELMKFIITKNEMATDRRSVLDLYAECLQATNGARPSTVTPLR